MITYILRRILSSIPVLFGILFVTFAIARLIPGDPCRAILGEKATDAICEDFIHRHGLDRPIHIQFATYVGEIAQGDFGESIRFNKPVTDLLIERLPTTLELTLAAMSFSIIVGIPIGHHLGRPAQLAGGCGHHDDSQHRRLHASFLVGA